MALRPVRAMLFAVCGAVAVLSTASCGAMQPTAVAPPQTPAPATSESPAADQSLTQTQYGPLSAADMKLMNLVRETSLREITTSQWAEQRSQNPMVKQAAQTIITQHVQLQNMDLQAAKTLGLTLPDKPAPDMQEGIDRMRTETGVVFDTDYVNTLRQAHGEAFILIAQVRADTRNSVVRPLADAANDFIKTHIQVLEKTGDVDYTQLPVPSAS
jgi:predicted outer membrane protein